MYKINSIVTFMALLLLLSCGSSGNSPEFMEQVAGRYLYNSDEVIEIYFENDELYMKWRGAQAIKPLKVDAQSFYVKEMNEKIQFLPDSDGSVFMSIIRKEQDTLETPRYQKMFAGQRVPREYLNMGNFEKALEGYLAIFEKDSMDPAVEEAMINRWGYQLLRNDSIDKSVLIFKINVALYPDSPNVYDSLGEALFNKGDSIGALENYTKAFEMDSSNRRAERMINRLQDNEE